MIGSRMRPIWDRELPSLEIENVELRADRLTAAWHAIGTAHLVRSVLANATASPDAPFVFQSNRCTVADIYRALASNYGLDRLQDQTGVTWLRRGAASTEALARRIRVPRDQPGLPMQSGILEPLGASAASLNVKSWGSAFLNTFDYAVDIPANTYQLDDVINLCCLANPSKTFAIYTSDGATVVSAVNLAAESTRPLRAGAALYWDREVRHTRRDAEPSDDDLVAALSHSDADVRAAARNYLEARIERVDVDALVRRADRVDDALWTCVGVTSVLVRSESATHTASIEVMQARATDEFMTLGDPGLATVAALDLMRLTRERHWLDIVSERRIDARALRAVVPDVCRVAALSPFVREALGDPRHQWLAGAIPGVGSTKLEFQNVD